MKKFFAILLAVVFAMAVLTGCGGSASSAPAKDYNINDVKAAIEGANAIANPLEMDEFTLEFDLGLTMENVAEYVGVKSNDQGNSGTILVIKAAAGKAADVAAQLETYKQNQVAFFANYAEFAAGQAQIEDGRVVTNGDYVVLVLANTDGASYDDIDKAVDGAFN